MLNFLLSAAQHTAEISLITLPGSVVCKIGGKVGLRWVYTIQFNPYVILCKSIIYIYFSKKMWVYTFLIVLHMNPADRMPTFDIRLPRREFLEPRKQRKIDIIVRSTPYEENAQAVKRRDVYSCKITPKVTQDLIPYSFIEILN
jgi:hypothetical protein